jgi:hypothetical protein
VLSDLDESSFSLEEFFNHELGFFNGTNEQFGLFNVLVVEISGGVFSFFNDDLVGQIVR